jgi:predicted phage terminase large subunit-like protein
MEHELQVALREELLSFVRKAFREEHGEKLGKQPYIDYLCYKLSSIATGKERRLVINLPPRHLKTFVAAICLAAWVLGRYPSTRILIVACSDQLAEYISLHTRKILRSEWYKNAFKTRVADHRAKINDFETTQGGGVYAVSVGGAITGRGADLIIFDDPLEIRDCNNPEQIARVNERFDSLILSRLNNPKQGRAVIIAHRLNEDDLSGHVIKQGGWRRIALPLIATRKTTYDLGYGEWQRKKNELLRPDAFSRKKIEQLRRTINPDFETLYQQNPGGGASINIKRENFAIGSFHFAADLPVVLSIEPGQRGGANHSFSVIQAWNPRGSDHVLLDQWREQCSYDQLRSAYWSFVRKYRPAAAFIECTANGPALIADARRGEWPRIIEVTPDGRSKTERLVAQIRSIRDRHIHLPDSAPWREAYVAEFIEFPKGRFDDQVDATTQYLDWIAGNPPLIMPPRRALGAVAGSRGQPLVAAPSAQPTAQCRGGVMMRGRI